MILVETVEALDFSRQDLLTFVDQARRACEGLLGWLEARPCAGVGDAEQTECGSLIRLSGRPDLVGRPGLGSVVRPR